MDLTVKQLRGLLKQKKAETRSCAAISRMNKAELVEHAQRLGLIRSGNRRPVEPVAAARRSKKPFFLEIIAMEADAARKKPTSISGKKKKESFLRRVQRVIDVADTLSEAERVPILNKLRKDIVDVMNSR